MGLPLCHGGPGHDRGLEARLISSAYCATALASPAVRIPSALAVIAVALSALVLGSGGAWAHEGDDEPVPADTGDGLLPVYEVPSGADRIIGSPEAGPDPLHSGDRGGSLQFATLGAVAAAVAFIMWRITRAARRSPQRTPADSTA